MSILVETDLVIPMRDGCRLYADVYRPADDQEHPTLAHIAYVSRRSKTGIFLVLNPIETIERGYALVIADARGTFGSEGDWTPFHDHGSDGYDVVEWSASQPWSNGKVGMFGSSGQGMTVSQTLVAAPPHLRAAMLLYTGANPFDGWAYSNGVLEWGFAISWAADITARSRLSRVADPARKEALAESLRDAVADPARLFRHLPLSDDSLLPRDLAPWLYEWLAHDTYDDYWESVDAVAHANLIRCPVLQVAGWYDSFLRGQLDLAHALRSHPDPSVRDTSRILIGPWDHHSYITIPDPKAPSSSGVRDFGPDASTGIAFMTDTGLTWFDRWLRDPGAAAEWSGSDSLTADRVKYYSVGARTWRSTDAWPPASSPFDFYLHSNGKANTRFGDGWLDGVAAANEPPDTYVYDPLDPVPSVGGSTTLVGPAGIQNQADVEERSDVLVYTSGLLHLPLAIAGSVSLELFAATSGVDTDFTAKLVDVEPTGFCVNACEGIARVGVELAKATSTMTTGATVQVSIRLNDIAYQFNVGHRVRVEISSSNFPRFARNLNSPTHPHNAKPADALPAVQRIFHDADRPSRLVVPVVEPQL
jgi:putative CocE/NonD family hydrolase